MSTTDLPALEGLRLHKRILFHLTYSKAVSLNQNSCWPLQIIKTQLIYNRLLQKITDKL